MSDVFYPISLIGKLESTPYTRVLGDDFSDGTTATRKTWSSQFFKRAFRLRHEPMTAAEFQYLRSFYSQRTGPYDSFWFRDNVHLEGNAKVRFTAPVPREYSGALHLVTCEFEEVAPIRALPEWDEVLAAAGSAPQLWWDPNREIYYTHAGTTYQASQVNDFYLPTATYPAVFQAGSFATMFGGTLEQNQYFRGNGTAWAKTASNISAISAVAQPAVTLFCMARHSANLNTQALFTVGTSGTNSVIGIGMHTSGDYSIYLGTSLNSQWTNSNNTGGSTPDTWRSLCISTTVTTNQELCYLNGAIHLNNISTARSYSAGPATIGANSAGTDKANTGGTGAKSDLAQCMVFASQLSPTQIANLHNLFAPMYGLASV